MRRWQLVRVHGPSMVPTLRTGDVVLVRRIDPAADGFGGSGDHAGRVVLGRFRTMPATVVVKRAVGPRDGGWLLRSDNRLAGGDSTVHGVADVEAEALLRWQPGVHLPRRIGPAPDLQTSDEP